jgi:hypothetical protein
LCIGKKHAEAVDFLPIMKNRLTIKVPMILE